MKVTREGYGHPFFGLFFGAEARVGLFFGAEARLVLSAFAVISYTENAVYVAFAALGSWLGAFVSVTWLRWGEGAGAATRHNPP